MTDRITMNGLKLDPKLMLALAVKMMQQPQQQPQQLRGSGSGVMDSVGLNLLNQILSNGGAIGDDPSVAIYRSYAQLTGQTATVIRPKAKRAKWGKLPYPGPGGKVVLDIDFQFAIGQETTCRTTAPVRISHCAMRYVTSTLI